MDLNLKKQVYEILDNKSSGPNYIMQLCFRYALDCYNDKDINELIHNIAKGRFDEEMIPHCEKLCEILMKEHEEIISRIPSDIDTFVMNQIRGFCYDIGFNHVISIDRTIFKLRKGDAGTILKDPYIYTKKSHPSFVQLELISNVLLHKSVDKPILLQNEIFESVDEPKKQKYHTKYENPLIDIIYDCFIGSEEELSNEYITEFLDLVANFADNESEDNSYLKRVINREFRYNDNKACVLCLDKVLYGLNFESFREYIIDNNYLETIIQMPEEYGINREALAYRNAVLLVLNKNKTDDLVRIVDLKENQTFLSQMVIKVNSNNHAITKKINELKDDHYDLSVSKIVGLSELNGPEFTTLIELCVDIYRGDNYLTAFKGEKSIVDRDLIYKYVNNQMLDDDLIDDENLIEAYSRVKKVPFLLKNGDVLITGKFSKPKCSILRLKDKNLRVAANGNLFIIRCKETQHTPYFIKNFLDSPKGSLILDCLAKGQAVKMLKINDLKNMPIPNLDDRLLVRVAVKSKRLLEEIKLYKEKLAESYEEYQTLAD